MLQLLEFAKLIYTKCTMISHISFQPENFLELMDVVANTSYKITQNWVSNLNGGIKHLIFCIIGQSHMVCFFDYLINIHSIIIQEGFDQVIRGVKVQCTIACDLLVFELEGKFLNHELINVLRIIYSQYWLQPNSEFTCGPFGLNQTTLLHF